MLLVERKPFKAIEFMSQVGATIRVEEDMEITVTIEETGELIAGTVVKIATKELILHVEDESFGRVIPFVSFNDVKIGIVVEE